MPPQKLRCTVADITAHGEGVYTVVLRPERPAPRFRPGQFLHLTLDPYDPTRFWPESRAFSIASDPGDRTLLRITYSTQGRFTRRMEQELEPGRDVWVKMPYGEFVISPEGEIVLLAGGTGITAFTAFLEQLQPAGACQVLLAYGARHPGLLVYRDLIDRAAQRSACLVPLYFAEQSSDIDIVIGRVTLESVWPRLARPLEARYFIAGPPLMLKALEGDLRSRNVRPEAIHIDAWE
jgi:ferredoxin-NADP reductase